MHGQVPPRRDEAQPRRAGTSGSSAPTRTTRTAGRTCFEVDRPLLHGRDPARATTTCRPDGRVMEMLQRAPVPGLARRLPADRPARLLHLLRGVHPHRRLDVQPAREVAEGLQPTSRGGGRSRRSTTCSRRHVWRQDHNGFSHQDPGFIDHVVNKKAEVDPRLPAAGRELPAVASPTTACAAGTTST